MKKISYLFVVFLSATLVSAQNVNKIENLKDAWGITFTYTGEVKDGKPNGMGVASYNTGNIIRYTGNFVNGMYSGKGFMLFKSGAFLSGVWYNGKLNGRGVNYTEDGGYYVGEFANGIKNGRGIFVYKDNGIMVANYKNDKLYGRGIQLWSDPTIVSDCNYDNDQRNGLGLQYEAKTKKLYEGEWKDDKWVQSATVSFSSFLKAPGFTGENTSTQVLVGGVNSSRRLTDTAYYYKVADKKRYFGSYVDGKLKRGIIIRDDSTRFVGQLGEKGAEGYCYDFKFNKYFSEGFYSNDYLNGQALDVDLNRKTIYIGEVVNGTFTGKACLFNSAGTMYAGDFVRGSIDGKGYRIEASGKILSGIWKNGTIEKLEKAITKKGELISGEQKTFAEAINNVIKTYPSIFDEIYGPDVKDSETLKKMDDFEEDLEHDYTKSLIIIPGSVGANLIAEDYDFNSFYYAQFIESENFNKAKDKYYELVKQLQTLIVSNAYLTGKQKLNGPVKVPDAKAELTATVFSVTGDASEFKDFRIWLQIRQNSSSKYVVELILGDEAGMY